MVGCGLRVGAALADGNANVENVDAAWGFVKRNYYDQAFNGQDWDAQRERYLARARRGEGAQRLSREMVASLDDRYSRVLDAGQFEKLMAYDPLGIGVVLARNESAEVVICSPPFAGSTGAQAGLRSGDVVVAINGADFSKETIFAVMDRVAQGDAAQVKLSLRRGQSAWEETLPRERADTKESKVEVGVVPVGAHRVGYLRLRNFGARSALDMADALASARADGADELVLDLRGNLGGSFQAALEIAALFLEPDVVATRVQTPSSGDRPLKVSSSSGTAREPLVVLVDQQSASASEVLAAALRGNCRAPLLGSKTFGKAAVQAVFGLPNREALALTVAKYSGPGGFAIGDGLRPDAPGPAGPIARAAAVLGLATDLSPGDYANVDFGAGSERALRTCRPGEAW